MSAALTITFDEATRAQLDEAATARHMTPEALAEAAVSMFLNEDAHREPGPLQPWQAEKIREGLEAADRGDFASDEEMERIFNKYRE